MLEINDIEINTETLDFNDIYVPIHVMIADDNKSICKDIMSAVLEEEPMARISVVESGDELESHIYNSRPDILFTNIYLPGKNGAEATFMAQQRNARPVTVLMSGKPVKEWVELSSYVNAYEFLKFPIDSQHIKNLIKSIEKMRNPLPVLFASASQKTRALFSRIVTQSHFLLRVEETDSGSHVHKLHEMNSYEIIFIDLSLNGVDALEVACRIQNNPKDTKLVLVSSPGSEKFENSAAHFGFKNYLQKPFEVQHVEDVLHDIFDLRRPYLLNETGRIHARKKVKKR